jgi:hypothetical protein
MTYSPASTPPHWPPASSTLSWTDDPGPLRYIVNSVGPPLPENICDQVRNDLTGSTATPGHLIRSMIAFLPVYVVVALLLSPPVLRAAVLVLAVLLALVDSFAFIALSRRLAQRCCAEDRENARTARQHEYEREQYERSYGHR